MTSNFKWGTASLAHRGTLCPELQVVVDRALEISPFDISITEGFRDRGRQEQMVREGRSKVHWPNSMHNINPSLAVDLFPRPVGMPADEIWKNPLVFHALAGVMFAAAEAVSLRVTGYKLRWGGDWDGDWTAKDQSFHDLPHFELRRI